MKRASRIGICLVALGDALKGFGEETQCDGSCGSLSRLWRLTGKVAERRVGR
jgi:hypothetical protein